MTLDKAILRKISAYKPKNGLDHIAKFFISLSSIKHGNVTGHVERVALLSEAVAKKVNVDPKLAFFAGLLHDVGKIVLPADLFSGRNITKKEYEIIKQHAIFGSKILSNTYLFTGLCCGLHHAVYQRGYGLTIKDFPQNMSINVLKKVLEISSIVSICDFIEAYTHRRTKILSNSELKGKSLEEMLNHQYPFEYHNWSVALIEYPKIKYWLLGEYGPIMKCGICGGKISATKGHIMVRNHDGYLVGYECWKCKDKEMKRRKVKR